MKCVFKIFPEISQHLIRKSKAATAANGNPFSRRHKWPSPN